MASYLRFLFRGSSSASKDRDDPPSAKLHQRSQSASAIPHVQPQNLVNSTPPKSSTAMAPSSRTHSNASVAARENAPSPLRYGIYDSTPPSSRSHCGHQPYASPSHPKPPYPYSSVVPLHRTSSHRVGERPPIYPLYRPAGSFSSTHSSNSSIYAPSSSSQRPHPPRNSSSRSMLAGTSEPRPVLKQTHSGKGSSRTGPHAHVSFENPNRSIPTHVHPLLASTRLHPAPISYDIIYAPSTNTVLDMQTRTPIPAHTLSQSATEPPTVGKLVLKAEKLPWSIVVSSLETNKGPSSTRQRRFYLGGGSNSSTDFSSSSARPSPITNLDILYTLHTEFSRRVTQQEWEALGHGSRAQRKVTQAYEKRCKSLGGGWEGGLRRVDLLEGKTRFIGVEMRLEVGDGGIMEGKLSFSKA